MVVFLFEVVRDRNSRHLHIDDLGLREGLQGGLDEFTFILPDSRERDLCRPYLLGPRYIKDVGLRGRGMCVSKGRERASSLGWRRQSLSSRTLIVNLLGEGVENAFEVLLGLG